jgi:hypothetical protein
MPVRLAGRRENSQTGNWFRVERRCRIVGGDPGIVQPGQQGDRRPGARRCAHLARAQGYDGSSAGAVETRKILIHREAGQWAPVHFRAVCLVSPIPIDRCGSLAFRISCQLRSQAMRLASIAASCSTRSAARACHRRSIRSRVSSIVRRMSVSMRLPPATKCERCA